MPSFTGMVRQPSKSWYLRVKTPGQPPFIKSLGRNVQSREQAIVAGQMLYQEVKGKVQRGRRGVSLITEQLIKKYLTHEKKQLTDIPKAGIVPETLSSKQNYLQIWQNFIDQKKLTKKKIEQISRDVGKNSQSGFRSKKRSHTEIEVGHLNTSILASVRSRGCITSLLLKKDIYQLNMCPNSEQ